jgi:hypothetical protein
MSWLERYRAFIIVFLIAVILSGVAVFLYRQTSLPHSEEIAILPPSPQSKSTFTNLAIFLRR